MMTPIQIVQMIKNGGNPQQIVLNMLEQSATGNPIVQNLMALAKDNNKQGIENFARNLMKEKGLDFDTEFNAFRKNLGL